MRTALGLLALLAILGLAACGSTPPPSPPPSPTKATIHVVRAGDTLWSLSRRYGTTVRAIASANHLRNANAISVGQRLYIPPATRAPIERDANPWAASHPGGRSAGKPEFAWPVRGRVSSGFGMRNGAHHDGIDIRVSGGTPILAAEEGRVVHSDGSLAGYGNTVIVKHAGAYSTVYAHNRRNLVHVGQFVERGQPIAEVGRTGRASAPHVHFEIRRDGSPLDPLEYLP